MLGYNKVNVEDVVKIWIFVTSGFVSAVQHRDNHDNLMVRARDKESLEHMLTSIELAGKALAEDGSDVTVDQDLQIVTSSKGDYRHRVTMSKSTFALYLQFECLNFLNYPNFKSELAKFRGPEFTKAAHRVWDDMHLVSDGPQVYGTVGVGGKRIAKKYKTGGGGFVGSTFLDERDADWGSGYHTFSGPEDEGALTEPSYKDQFEEAEAEFDVLPEGSESWTDEEFDAYLDSVAPGRADVTPENFLTPAAAALVAKTATTAEPAAGAEIAEAKAAAVKVTPKTAAVKKSKK